MVIHHLLTDSKYKSRSGWRILSEKKGPSFFLFQFGDLDSYEESRCYTTATRVY